MSVTSVRVASLEDSTRTPNPDLDEARQPVRKERPTPKPDQKGSEGGESDSSDSTKPGTTISNDRKPETGVDQTVVLPKPNERPPPRPRPELPKPNGGSD